MSRKKRVLLDVDGPLTASLVEKACEFLRANGVAHAKPKAITQWSIAKALGLSRELERALYAHMHSPGFVSSFVPRDGADGFMRNLRAQGPTVLAVTAPLDGAPTWAYEREEWLCEHLGFERRDVVSARDKAAIWGDALVEDKLINLASWQAAHPHGLGILWHEAHNASEPWRGPMADNYRDLFWLLEAVTLSK